MRAAAAGRAPTAGSTNNGIENSRSKAAISICWTTDASGKVAVADVGARTRIDASQYPRVQMTVMLYTLSLDEAWLVV